MKTLNIPAPEFGLYEPVILYWNGKEYRSKIVECRFELADGCWTYELAAYDGFFFPGSALARRVLETKTLARRARA